MPRQTAWWGGHGVVAGMVVVMAGATAHTDWYQSRASGDIQFNGSPPYLPYANGTSFSSTLTDHAVLQRGATQHAAVYGAVVDPRASARTTVTVTVLDRAIAGAQPKTVPVTVMSVVPGVNITWKALLPPRSTPGGDITVTAGCTNCANMTKVSIDHLTYGDVWLCSGQSNMELPMEHALTRNRTYAALDNLGEYSNIRIFSHHKHDQRPDGQEIYVLPPSPPPSWDKRTGLPNSFYGWQHPNSTNVDSFSAACWFFAQELTDMALTANQSAPIIGLIQSAWGGTKIENWVRRSSVAECKNASGGTIIEKPGYGEINNGMIAPFLNYTIFGALWYQGENNVGDCLSSPYHKMGDDGPTSCGNVLNTTGYACLQHKLVVSWRRQFSATPGTTSPNFPIGIVSLAAGTSEGNSQNMPNFRLAQTASYGFLPGPAGSGMENTFIAQGYDAGDPGFRAPGSFVQAEVDSPFQANYDRPFPGRVGYSAGGHQFYTRQFMGGLHPRAKQTIGRRLALAAQAIAYADDTVPFTGPVFAGCTVHPENMLCPHGERCRLQQGRGEQRQITVQFNEDLLRADAVKVWPTTPAATGLAITAMYNCLNGTCLESCGANSSCVWSCVYLNTPPCAGVAGVSIGGGGNAEIPPAGSPTNLHFKSGTSLSPLEVQYNNSLWVPASLMFKAQPRTPLSANGSRLAGWSSVIATVPTGLPIGCTRLCPPQEHLHPGQYCVNCSHVLAITGVRYAWSEQPCCGGDGSFNQISPCPVNSCPISTYNSTLPAVPFTATVTYSNDSVSSVGSCECQAPQVC